MTPALGLLAVMILQREREEGRRRRESLQKERLLCEIKTEKKECVKYVIKSVN